MLQDCGQSTSAFLALFGPWDRESSARTAGAKCRRLVYPREGVTSPVQTASCLGVDLIDTKYRLFITQNFRNVNLNGLGTMKGADSRAVSAIAALILQGSEVGT